MKKSLTTIEIGDHYIKLLEAKRLRGAPCLTYCEIQDKKPGLGSDLHPVLTRMVSAKELALEDVVIVVPRRHVFLKLITLPTLSHDELTRMIPLQLSHLTPFARDEIIYNYSVVSQDPSGYTQVLLAVIQKEVVGKLLAVLQEAHVSSHKVALTAEGIEAWVKMQGKDGHLETKGVVMVVDIDAQNSEVCFFSEGKLDFSRHIQCGMDDIGQEAMASFAEAIGLTLGVYKKESGHGDIARAVVISSSPKGSILKETLAKLYACPIDVMAPLDNIVRDKKMPVPQSCQDQGVSITAGAGFCSYFQEPEINLIPPDVVDRKRMRSQQKVVMRFLFVLFMALVLGGAILTLDISRKDMYLKKLEAKIGDVDKQVTQAEDKFAFLKFAQDQRQNRIFIPDVIRLLYQIIPDTVSFRALLLNAQGVFEIQGYADTQASINQVQNRLVNSKIFEDITLQYATKRKRFNDEFMEFKLSCRIKVRQESNGQ